MRDEHVVLVRHGEVDRAALGEHGPVYTGARFDHVPLSHAGTVQAEQAAAALRSLRPQLILTSPYTRTLQTAAIISRNLDCRFTVDLRLHDWLPVRDGTMVISLALVQAKIREYERWAAGGPLPQERTWETPDEMRARLLSVIRAHRNAVPLVIVTHEAPVQAVIGPVAVPPGSLHPVPSTAIDPEQPNP